MQQWAAPYHLLVNLHMAVASTVISRGLPEHAKHFWWHLNCNWEVWGSSTENFPKISFCGQVAGIVGNVQLMVHCHRTLTFIDAPKVLALEILYFVTVYQHCSLLLADIMLTDWCGFIFDNQATVVMCAGICWIYLCLSTLDHNSALGHCLARFLLGNVGSSKLIPTTWTLGWLVSATVRQCALWAGTFPSLRPRNGSGWRRCLGRKDKANSVPFLEKFNWGHDYISPQSQSCTQVSRMMPQPQQSCSSAIYELYQDCRSTSSNHWQ